MSRIERYQSTLAYPFSKAVRAGGFLFFSGVIALDDKGEFVGGEIEAQTRTVLERIRSELDSLGSGVSDVVRVTVWLSDINDFARFNAVYREYFRDALPCRSLVQAALIGGARVEIEVQALAPAPAMTAQAP